MQFIALTSIGIENLLVDELTALGAEVSKQTVGSVRFEADSLLAQKICLSSRFATRIMMLIEEKEGVKDKDSLYQFARLQPWQEWFGAEPSASDSRTITFGQPCMPLSSHVSTFSSARHSCRGATATRPHTDERTCARSTGSGASFRG